MDGVGVTGIEIEAVRLSLMEEELFGMIMRGGEYWQAKS